MKNLIAYKTDIQLTANIIETLSNSINKYIKGSTSKTLHINEFLKNGITITSKQKETSNGSLVILLMK